MDWSACDVFYSVFYSCVIHVFVSPFIYHQACIKCLFFLGPNLRYKRSHRENSSWEKRMLELKFPTELWAISQLPGVRKSHFWMKQKEIFTILSSLAKEKGKEWERAPHPYPHNCEMQSWKVALFLNPSSIKQVTCPKGHRLSELGKYLLFHSTNASWTPTMFRSWSRCYGPTVVKTCLHGIYILCEDGDEK